MTGTNPPDRDRWRVFPDTDALADAVADHVERALEQAIRERGEFHLVLPAAKEQRTGRVQGGVHPRSG